MGGIMELEQLNKKIEALETGEVLRLEGIDDHIYHASIGYGSTAIKKMCDCPAVFKEYIDNHEHKTTDDLIKGQAIHMGVLTPFDSDLFVYQPEEIKTRSGKVWEEFKEQHEDKVILRANWRDLIDGAVGSVLDNYGHLLVNGDSEVSWWRLDEEYDVLIKGRIDFESPAGIIDLKTTVSVKPSKFGRDAKSYGYHVQEAAYVAITGAPSFRFLVVEKEPPFLSGLFEFDEDCKRLGYLKYRQAVRQIAECAMAGVYPGYTDHCTVMELSPWERREIDELEELY